MGNGKCYCSMMYDVTDFVYGNHPPILLLHSRKQNAMLLNWLRAGSQYDAGTVNIPSVVSVIHTKKFFTVHILFLHDVKFFNSLIGWMLAITPASK